MVEVGLTIEDGLVHSSVIVLESTVPRTLEADNEVWIKDGG